MGGACLPTGASRGGTQARCLKRQLSLPVSSPTRVPRNTGFPPMTLPFNRSLVGARVKRISSARAPEMCPFSKTIRENQTVRETFQGFANPTGQRPGAQVPVPPQLPCVRCWRWPRRCWRARSPIAAASTTRPSTVFRVGPPCSGQQRTGTPALGKPRKRFSQRGWNFDSDLYDLMCLGQRDTGTRGTDGSQTHRWRERDSNPWSPGRDSIFETAPFELSGPAFLRARRVPSDRKSKGSNPAAIPKKPRGKETGAAGIGFLRSMWCLALTSHTGACARPTRTRNKPWVTVVLARYSSARSCLR